HTNAQPDVPVWFCRCQVAPTGSWNAAVHDAGLHPVVCPLPADDAVLCIHPDCAAACGPPEVVAGFRFQQQTRCCREHQSCFALLLATMSSRSSSGIVKLNMEESRSR